MDFIQSALRGSRREPVENVEVGMKDGMSSDTLQHPPPLITPVGRVATVSRIHQFCEMPIETPRDGLHQNLATNSQLFAI